MVIITCNNQNKKKERYKFTTPGHMKRYEIL
jgi:hypothetical protein